MYCETNTCKEGANTHFYFCQKWQASAAGQSLKRETMTFKNEWKPFVVETCKNHFKKLEKRNPSISISTFCAERV